MLATVLNQKECCHLLFNVTDYYLLITRSESALYLWAWLRLLTASAHQPVYLGLQQSVLYAMMAARETSLPAEFITSIRGKTKDAVRKLCLS